MLRVGVTIKQTENKHLQNLIIFRGWIIWGGTAPECPPVAAGLDQEPVPGRESTKYTLVEKQLAF